jgi:hypothetical protein
MCTHGTNRKIVIEQEIVVDSCIADEIVWLNKNGVFTINCCCGHGKSESEAIIVNSCFEKAEKMGYNTWLDDSWNRCIELKGEKFKGREIKMPNIVSQGKK